MLIKGRMQFCISEEACPLGRHLHDPKDGMGTKLSKQKHMAFSSSSITVLPLPALSSVEQEHVKLGGINKIFL